MRKAEGGIIFHLACANFSPGTLQGQVLGPSAYSIRAPRYCIPAHRPVCPSSSESCKYWQHLGIGDLANVTDGRKSFISWAEAGRKLVNSGHRLQNREMHVKRWTSLDFYVYWGPETVTTDKVFLVHFFLYASCKIHPSWLGDRSCSFKERAKSIMTTTCQHFI